MVTTDNYLELPAYTREVRAAVGRRRLKVGNQRLPGRMDGLWPVMWNSPPRVVVYPSKPQKVKAYWCQDSKFSTSCSLGNWGMGSPFHHEVLRGVWIHSFQSETYLIILYLFLSQSFTSLYLEL